MYTHLSSLEIGVFTLNCVTMLSTNYFPPYVLILIMIATVCPPTTSSSPIRTIQSPDGDVIDCINKFDQPALKHPLLQNHQFQELPTGMVTTDYDGFGWQVWHANGEACPVGTVPIRRFVGEQIHTKYGIPPMSDSEKGATQNHLYAIAYLGNQSIYGTKTEINVWSPVVKSGEDFSLAQIWLRSGEYENNDLNTIEAGWQVYPNRYGDGQPRLFTYWTRDAYINTGCYSTHCEGFVHVSNTVALEAAINTTSTRGGEQMVMSIQIWKDTSSGNWWMAMGPNIVPVGYWPAAIFTTLADHANQVQWGGEVYYRNLSRTVAEMGSGEFPNKGYRKAAYFCNMEVAGENQTFVPVQDFGMGASQPDIYTVKKAQSTTCGNHIYYGGPGPVHSESSRGATISYMFLAFSMFWVVFV